MGLFDFIKKFQSEKKHSENVIESEKKVEENAIKVEDNTIKDTTPKREPVSIKISMETKDIIPIEERIAGKLPTCDGLFPHEILVLSYANTFLANEENTFQNFWQIKYGVSDVQNILDMLKTKGYIQIGSVKDAISKENLPVIKEELKKYDLKCTGKKEDLINRLRSSVPEDDLSVAFSHIPYSLTSLGEEIIKKYEWIPYIHSHSIENLDIWTLTDLMEQPPYTNYRDKIWGYLNKQCLNYMQHMEFGMYSGCKLTMSDFVAEEEKYDTALDLLCEVIMLDLCWEANNNSTYDISLMANPDYLLKFFPYENSKLKLPPGIIKKLQKYTKKLKLSEDELYDYMKNEFNKISVSFNGISNCFCTTASEAISFKGRLTEEQKAKVKLRRVK